MGLDGDGGESCRCGESVGEGILSVFVLIVGLCRGDGIARENRSGICLEMGILPSTVLSLIC